MNNGIGRSFFTVAVVASITTALIGCGNKVSVEIPEESEVIQEDVELDTAEQISEPKEEAAESAVLGESAQSFSEGLAWVKFAKSSGEQERYACIDKEGNVLFAFPEGCDDMKPTPFDNGYSFISNDADLMTIGHITSNCQSIISVDKKGNVKTFNVSDLGDTTNVDKEEREITACGGGYFVMYRHQQADFDNNDYPWIYEVYDAEGNYIDSLNSSSATWTTYYRGQGMFEFKRDYNGDDSVLFFPKVDKFIQTVPTTDVVFVDGEDMAFVAEGEEIDVLQAVGEEDWQDSTVSGLVFVSKDGEITTYAAPDEVWALGDDPRVSDDLIVLYGWGDEREGKTYYSYDVKRGVLKKMPEEYAQHELTAERAIFHDGVCAMLVLGADNRLYYSVYDSEWNRLFDPIEAMSDHTYLGGAGGGTYVLYGGAYYSEGLMAIMMADGSGDYAPAVIDKSGKVVFKRDGGRLSQLIDGVFVYTPYSSRFDEKLYESGVPAFTVSGGNDEQFEFLDRDGKPLFDELITDDMKILSFT